MSSVRDFIDLDKSTKTICVSVALLMPFWYMDIYLFSKIPFDKNIQIPIVISFCLSFCLYAFSILIDLAGYALLGKKEDYEKYNIINSTSVLISLPYITIITIFEYVYRFPFSKFIFIVFGSMFATFLLLLLLIAFKKDN